MFWFIKGFESLSTVVSLGTAYYRSLCRTTYKLLVAHWRIQPTSCNAVVSRDLVTCRYHVRIEIKTLRVGSSPSNSLSHSCLLLFRLFTRPRIHREIFMSV